LRCSVNRDLGYPIVIGRDLQEGVASFARRHFARCVVLSDANPHVLGIARAIAGRTGATLCAFQLGERRKRLATVERVLDALAAAGADRGTLALGTGGGVASDLFGFAAAVYMRGIAYAHVATSLVAMADAAVGGKTGVNLRCGKNLAGVFWDPRAVFCDVSCLRTLPVRSLREGLAEIVKAGILQGPELFDTLERLARQPFERWPWSAVVARAVRVKTEIVARDRRESGPRELLNLGHTFAHAIERASNFRVMHGSAVALGLRAAGLLALRTGRFRLDEHERVVEVLRRVGLPLRTSLEVEPILAAMSADKKRRQGRLRFVLPRAIGTVEYGVECGRREIRAALNALRRAP
jgi:3-dehydroquinate synthase